MDSAVNQRLNLSERNCLNLSERHSLDAKNCVTGSCHLIRTQLGTAHSVNILVDCGKAQGHDPELPFDQFPVPHP